ncbi:hypothetical protein Cni_G15468 [Canna indica]|uniref:F-box domain-containing protein n=1 Tax=Canna indica TaxID=4628 RepID=A0AAQ3QDB3_9LILI|nr:hypothetical protein Cni_G15468 [Canna indica]
MPDRGRYRGRSLLDERPRIERCFFIRFSFGSILQRNLPLFGPEMETGSGSSRSRSRSRPDLNSFFLPCDLALSIVSLLEASDVCSLACCSRFWREICASDSVWMVLYKRRWPSKVDLVASPPQGYRDFYIKKHQIMANGVSAATKFLEECSQSWSLEVGYYLKAIADLGSLCLDFKDVQLFLLRKEKSVLLNLIGLHYCIFSLDIPPIYVMEALENCQVSKRQVCVNWFTLGRWFFGYRWPDEHHCRILSLIELAVGKEQAVLGVLNRGAIHETGVDHGPPHRHALWLAAEAVVHA